MKKSLTLLLAFLLSVSVLCGCENIEQTEWHNESTTEAAAVEDTTTQTTDKAENTAEETPTPLTESSQGANADKGNTDNRKIKSHHINVGQADCEFIELPSGKTMLIDAGNSHDGNTIVSYIKGLNYNKIDYVVGTHPHADHIGGMATVLNNFEIGTLYIPEKSHTSQVFENMLNAIEDNNITLIPAKSGVNIFKDGNLQADILAPVGSSYSDLNEWSAVVKITYGKTELLYMGDATSRNESEIISSGASVEADILKVGHHGSETSSSSSFIRAVSPKHAVISCGINNQYGHPDSSTLAVLNSNGAKIYRTDEVGTIIITADSEENISIDKKASNIKENAPPSQSIKEEAEQERPSTTENQSVTVYRTKTGKKYHRDGCSYLKSRIETTVAEAASMGLTPCSRCQPPQ